MTENQYGNCPKCSKPLSADDYCWSDGQTEAGTEFWTVDVYCNHCNWTLQTDGWCGDYGEYNLPEVREKIDKEKQT